MATAIKRIEKDFFLKVIYDEQTPIIYLRNRRKYTLLLERPVKEEMYLKADQPIRGLWPRMKLDLMFEFRGMTLMCCAEIISINDMSIVTEAPEFLYKDLKRSFSRMPNPADLQVQFSLEGEHYDLSYPKVAEVEAPPDIGEIMQRVDPGNLTGLIAQIADWIKGFADGYKLIFFKDVKPASIEERVLAETGKIFYLPSTVEEFPKTDPFPQKRIITEDVFRRFLESTGIEPDALNNEVSKFLREKVEAHLYSEVFVPILFQKYVVGYIYSWSERLGKRPFTFETLETFYQFACVLSFSLKENGYFESGRISSLPFEGKMIDISVSGLLFATASASLAQSLQSDKDVLIKLTAPKRVINISAKIVRRFKDSALHYFGCRFVDMQPEDMRFFFEFLYSKPFTDKDAAFLSGQV